MEIFATTIGLVGVGMILLAYAGQQFGRVLSNGWWYLNLNLVGSLFILYSLFYQYNLPAVIIETAWVLITLFSISRRIRKVKKRRKIAKRKKKSL